jgi:hypothetical protein
VNDPSLSEEHEWEVGWEGHERAQRRRIANLPLPVKIRWLEEMQKVVEHLQEQRRKQKA